MTQQAQMLKALRELETIKLDGLRFRLIDAKGMIVGRLASEIATLLQGKDKPTYTPKKNMGDVVIVINAAHVHFTHDKWETKMYHWHTGYPGGYRERPAAVQWDKDPTSILVKAVQGMLPKNRLRPYRMDKLKVFPESSHPYTGLPLVPYVPQPRTLHLPGLSWQLPRGMSPMNPDIYSFRDWVGQKSPRQGIPGPSGSLGLLPQTSGTTSSSAPSLNSSSSSSRGAQPRGGMSQEGRQGSAQGGAGARGSSTSSSSGGASRCTPQQKAGASGTGKAAGSTEAAAQSGANSSSSPQSSSQGPATSAATQAPPSQQQQQQQPSGVARHLLGGKKGLSHFSELLTEEEQAALAAEIQRERQEQRQRRLKAQQKQQQQQQEPGGGSQQNRQS